jgi:hypothetical protein
MLSFFLACFGTALRYVGAASVCESFLSGGTTSTQLDLEDCSFRSHSSESSFIRTFAVPSVRIIRCSFMNITAATDGIALDLASTGDILLQANNFTSIQAIGQSHFAILISGIKVSILENRFADFGNFTSAIHNPGGGGQTVTISHCFFTHFQLDTDLNSYLVWVQVPAISLSGISVENSILPGILWAETWSGSLAFNRISLTNVESTAQTVRTSDLAVTFADCEFVNSLIRYQNSARSPVSYENCQFDAGVNKTAAGIFVANGGGFRFGACSFVGLDRALFSVEYVAGTAVEFCLSNFTFCHLGIALSLDRLAVRGCQFLQSTNSAICANEIERLIVIGCYFEPSQAASKPSIQVGNLKATWNDQGSEIRQSCFVSRKNEIVLAASADYGINITIDNSVLLMATEPVAFSGGAFSPNVVIAPTYGVSGCSFASVNPFPDLGFCPGYEDHRPSIAFPSLSTVAVPTSTRQMIETPSETHKPAEAQTHTPAQTETRTVTTRETLPASSTTPSITEGQTVIAPRETMPAASLSPAQVTETQPVTKERSPTGEIGTVSQSPAVTQTAIVKDAQTRQRTAGGAPGPNAGPDNFGDVNSTDTTAGIVVGACVGLLVVAAMVAAVWFVRGRSRHQSPEQDEEEDFDELMAPPTAMVCNEIDCFVSEYGFSDQHHAHCRTPDSDEELVAAEIEQAAFEHDSAQDWVDDVTDGDE